jgi:phosphatidylserine decarboxylase
MVFWKRSRAAQDKTQNVVDKPVEQIHPGNLPNVDKDKLALALTALVDRSATHSAEGLYMKLNGIRKDHWFHKFIPGLEDWANKYHTGNYVMIRYTNEKIFESMPLYAR